MESKVSIVDRINADHHHLNWDASRTAIAFVDRESPRRLWVAMVEHEAIPGTRAVLFFQANEPADDAILGRFSEDASPEDLSIAGLYDLSHVGEVDQLSRVALNDFVRGFGSNGIVDDRMAAGTPRSRTGLKEQTPRWFVGDLDHTWSWNEDGRMEVKCRVVVDVANERLLAAQVWGYESWCEADSDQNDDLAKLLFFEHKVGEAPVAFDLFEIDRLPEWATCAVGDQQVPPYQDDEVIGLDKDGCVVQWNSDNGMPANSGESLEEFGLHNLREYEFARVGVAREAWEAAVAEQANTLPSVNPTATHALQALIAAASSDVERFKLRLPEAKLPESANETPRIDRIIGGQNRVLVLHTKESDLTFIIPPGVSERDWLMQETLKAKSEAAGLYERAQQLMARAGHAHVAADLCDASEAGPSDSASAPSPCM
ncbi:hypothetical protein [Caballeronia sp. LjRoot31]|uniref:hypothetical protein n=1 Tax=Caballeronia sp. LjRoot31 TaxID=3342324 RepID=UPI003ECFDEF9